MTCPASAVNDDLYLFENVKCYIIFSWPSDIHYASKLTIGPSHGLATRVSIFGP